MTILLTPLNDVVEIDPPQNTVVPITAPTSDLVLEITAPGVAVQVIEAPTSAPLGLVVPVVGPPGNDGAPGAPGENPDDIPDMTLFFENGLF